MVFDVDKLKEAVEWATQGEQPMRGSSLGVIFAAARLVVAGQPSLRCMTHNVEVRWPDASNCVAGANNPELCELVKGWWMPTGGGE